MGLVPTNLVQIHGSSVRVNVTTRDEAKIALKELKLKKKEYGLKKRTIAAEQRAIRARYTEEVRTRGTMMRGGGTVGRIFRAIQTVSRDSRRARLAQELAPLEGEKQAVEEIAQAIDTMILKLEAALLRP